MTTPQGPCPPLACQHPATIPDQRGEETCQTCGAYVAPLARPTSEVPR